jgi:hypothetical protein
MSPKKPEVARTHLSVLKGLERGWTHSFTILTPVLVRMEYPSLNLVSEATTQKSFPAQAITVLGCEGMLGLTLHCSRRETRPSP